MENRLPVGPGSRGGSWHDREYRNAYHRAWRANHPEYRERERLRRARKRAQDRNEDPADIVSPAAFPRPLPLSAVHCVCECGCREHVVVVCGFCRSGTHTEPTDWQAIYDGDEPMPESA
jgi:hypothetical protein